MGVNVPNKHVNKDRNKQAMKIELTTWGMDDLETSVTRFLLANISSICCSICKHTIQ